MPKRPRSTSLVECQAEDHSASGAAAPSADSASATAASASASGAPAASASASASASGAAAVSLFGVAVVPASSSAAASGGGGLDVRASGGHERESMGYLLTGPDNQDYRAFWNFKRGKYALNASRTSTQFNGFSMPIHAAALDIGATCLLMGGGSASLDLKTYTFQYVAFTVKGYLRKDMLEPLC